MDFLIALTAGFAVGSSAPDGMRAEAPRRVWLPLLAVLSPTALGFVLWNQHLMAGSTAELFMGMALLAFGSRGLFLIAGVAWRARKERVQDPGPLREAGPP